MENEEVLLTHCSHRVVPEGPWDFFGVHGVKTVFIVTPRYYLPFSPIPSKCIHNPVTQCFPDDHCMKLLNHAWVSEPECKTDQETGRSWSTQVHHTGAGPTLQLTFKELVLDKS